MKSRKNKSPDAAAEDRKRNDALNRNEQQRSEKKLPGEYPPKEDIMNRMNTRRVGMDVENFSRAVGTENLNIDEPVVTDPNSIEEEPLGQEQGVEERRNRTDMEHPAPQNLSEDEEQPNESDVTEEDMQALGPKDLSMDMGEDEQLLKNRVWPVDMAGEDLDVPGSELDDKNEEIGSEDEENNSYSIGGDAHEDNLEGK